MSINEKFTDLRDELDELRGSSREPFARVTSIAITELEAAQRTAAEALRLKLGIDAIDLEDPDTVNALNGRPSPFKPAGEATPFKGPSVDAPAYSDQKSGGNPAESAPSETFNPDDLTPESDVGRVPGGYESVFVTSASAQTGIGVHEDATSTPGENIPTDSDDKKVATDDVTVTTIDPGQSDTAGLFRGTEDAEVQKDETKAEDARVISLSDDEPKDSEVAGTEPDADREARLSFIKDEPTPAAEVKVEPTPDVVLGPEHELAPPDEVDAPSPGVDDTADVPADDTADKAVDAEA